ncbi:MAG: hypothetical protein K2I01_07235, partial [Lachnospiraceae bacterium]|nr:hypothetical protein [Lachnospiraceae bacterium]
PLIAFIREPGTDTSVSAAYDSQGSGRVLVLINLSGKEESYALPDGVRLLAESGESTAAGTVAPYGYKLFALKDLPNKI